MRYRPTPLDWVMRAYLGSIILAGVADLAVRILGSEPLLLVLMKAGL